MVLYFCRVAVLFSLLMGVILSGSLAHAARDDMSFAQQQLMRAFEEDTQAARKQRAIDEIYTAYRDYYSDSELVAKKHLAELYDAIPQIVDLSVGINEMRLMAHAFADKVAELRQMQTSDSKIEKEIFYLTEVAILSSYKMVDIKNVPLSLRKTIAPLATYYFGLFTGLGYLLVWNPADITFIPRLAMPLGIFLVHDLLLKWPMLRRVHQYAEKAEAMNSQQTLLQEFVGTLATRGLLVEKFGIEPNARSRCLLALTRLWTR